MTKAKPTLLVLVSVLLLGGCASPAVTRTPSTALQHDVAAQTYLGAWARQAISDRPEGLSGLQLVSDGHDAFAMRASLAEHAQKSLDIQTYILEDDWTSHALLRRVLQAAQRGVHVRMLLDDTASLGKQGILASLDSHPLIDVRLFNPVLRGRSTWLGYHLALLFNFDRMHRRMHNKLWVADNTVAITGGRNLGDAYFEAAEETNFNDLDALAIGPVVNALSGSFDAFWNHSLAIPMRQFEQLPATAWYEVLAELQNEQTDKLLARPSVWRFAGDEGQELLRSLIWAPAVALWDLPEKLQAEGYPDLDLTLLGQLRETFQRLRHRLVIISPYVVPTANGIEYLETLIERDIELTIITNALEATDLASLHGVYMPWRPELLAKGVRLYEMRAIPEGVRPPKVGENSSLHTKAMAFDDRKIFIGSLNADPRSVWWNSEVGLLIESPRLSRQLWQLVERGMDPRRSYEVHISREGVLSWHGEIAGERAVLYEEPGGMWRHFKARLIQFMNIEELL